MIEVQIKPCSIHIEGHAGYAERGKDIVCSASSALLYTLESALERYEDMKLCEVHKTFYSGYAHIDAEPIATGEAIVSEAFNIIADGYRVLRDSYPDHVKIIEAST